MSNQYFKNTFFPQNNESTLYQNATNEIVQIHGIDMFYLPRTRVKDDFIFGEDVLSEFNSNQPITFFIENFTEYDGMGDLFGKFGFTPDNQITLVTEMDNFVSEVGQAPAKGDLIYYPAGDAILEISHSDEKSGFYQFNHNKYSYRIHCKLFEYSYEDINTNIDNIDTIDQESPTTDDESDQFDTEIATILDLTEADIFGNL